MKIIFRASVLGAACIVALPLVVSAQSYIIRTQCNYFAPVEDLNCLTVSDDDLLQPFKNGTYTRSEIISAMTEWQTNPEYYGINKNARIWTNDVLPHMPEGHLRVLLGGGSGFGGTLYASYDFVPIEAVPPTPTPTPSPSPSQGLKFIRNAAMSGWEDEKLLVPGDYHGQWQQAAPMECNFEETREVNLGCPSGYSGSRTRIDRRTWTATAPGQTPNWGPWEEVRTRDNCTPPRPSDDDDEYWDTNGDGRPDSSNGNSALGDNRCSGPMGGC